MYVKYTPWPRRQTSAAPKKITASYSNVISIIVTKRQQHQQLKMAKVNGDASLSHSAQK